MAAPSTMTGAGGRRTTDRRAVTGAKGLQAGAGRVGTTMSVFTKILRAGEGRKVKALREIVPDINAWEPEIEALSDDALRHKSVEFRERLANAGDDVDDAMNDLLIEAFAVVREAARRTIGQRHFDVQLMGGAA